MAPPNPFSRLREKGGAKRRMRVFEPERRGVKALAPTLSRKEWERGLVG